MKKCILLLFIPFLSFTQSGDTNGDGFTNLEDLFNVLDDWLQNVNDNDPEAISNLDEMTDLVDSLITLSRNINTHNIRFPEGTNGEIINIGLSHNGILEYEVPAGKRLYITKVFSYEGTMQIDDVPIVDIVSEDPESFREIVCPIIVNPNQIVTSNDNGEWELYINGLLVDEKPGIEGITRASTNPGFYTVPEGKNLYITYRPAGGNLMYITENEDFDMHRSFSGYTEHLPLPLMFNSNEQIKVSPIGLGSFNGYLVDENYFSSVSNSNLNDISEENTTYQVGDIAHGGVVIHTNSSGNHGIVMKLQTDPPYTQAHNINNRLSEINNEGDFFDWRLPTSYEIEEYLYPNSLLLYDLGIEIYTGYMWVNNFASGTGRRKTIAFQPGFLNEPLNTIISNYTLLYDAEPATFSSSYYAGVVAFRSF